MGVARVTLNVRQTRSRARFPRPVLLGHRMHWDGARSGRHTLTPEAFIVRSARCSEPHRPRKTMVKARAQDEATTVVEKMTLNLIPLCKFVGLLLGDRSLEEGGEA